MRSVARRKDKSGPMPLQDRQRHRRKHQSRQMLISHWNLPAAQRYNRGHIFFAGPRELGVKIVARGLSKSLKWLLSGVSVKNSKHVAYAKSERRQQLMFQPAIEAVERRILLSTYTVNT